MKSYRANVEWDGYAWIATLEGKANVFTQAKRLDSLKGRLAEVIHLMTGKTVSLDSIDLDIRVDEWGDKAADLRTKRAELERAEQSLAEQTAATVRALRKRGISLRDIGTLTGVSYQRVHQLVH